MMATVVSPLPVTMLFGLRLPVTGTPGTIVRLIEAEDPPPGAGVTIWTGTVPSVVNALAGTSRRRVVPDTTWGA